RTARGRGPPSSQDPAHHGGDEPDDEKQVAEPGDDEEQKADHEHADQDVEPARRDVPDGDRKLPAGREPEGGVVLGGYSTQSHVGSPSTSTRPQRRHRRSAWRLRRAARCSRGSPTAAASANAPSTEIMS